MKKLPTFVSAFLASLLIGAVASSATAQVPQSINLPEVSCRQPLQEAGYFSGHRAVSVNLTESDLSVVAALMSDPVLDSVGFKKVFYNPAQETGGVIIGWVDCGDNFQQVIDSNRWVEIFFWNPIDDSETTILVDLENNVFYAYDKTDFRLTDSSARRVMDDLVGYVSGN